MPSEHRRFGIAGDRGCLGNAMAEFVLVRGAWLGSWARCTCARAACGWPSCPLIGSVGLVDKQRVSAEQRIGVHETVDEIECLISRGPLLESRGVPVGLPRAADELVSWKWTRGERLPTHRMRRVIRGGAIVRVSAALLGSNEEE
jgi:hypothetical protein